MQGAEISQPAWDYDVNRTEEAPMDIDPQLLGDGMNVPPVTQSFNSTSATAAKKSNLRLFPPPLFSRQSIPQNYK